MISYSNIKHISRYESKAIKRGWFFKIAAIGTIGFFLIFILSALSSIFPNTGEWNLSSLAAKWPYSVMFIFNMMMPFVIVFLATGLMKKNKKLDTNEVFLARPLSNADYVLGRVMALIKPVLIIHGIVLLILLAGNIMSEDAPFNPIYYFFYPLIMSVPNLVFITGLSFMVVSLIKNQAVSLVVILGILGTILIEFSNSYHSILDYNAVTLPMLHSDIMGIENIKTILYQRGIFLSLGIAFLSFAILVLDRLPAKRMSKITSFSIGLLSLVIAIGFGYTYLNEVSWAPKKLRALARNINSEMYGISNVDITDCHLNVVHENNIKVKASLVLRNTSDVALDHYYFYLNPDLSITNVSKSAQPLAHTRTLHKIDISLDTPLQPNQSDSLVIEYEGGINEDIAYLGVEDKRREVSAYVAMFSIPKRHAFVTRDYLLLTSEVLWYPQTQPTHFSDVPGYQPRSFVNYTLELKTNEGLYPISQGAVSARDNNSYTFRPEQPLPQISLVVGKYDNRTINVDSTNYNFTTYKEHDYFVKYFDQVQDTIPEVVRELRKKLEQRVGLTYPFKRFTLVEVPVTFRAYFTLSQNHQAYSQPEIVFMPEMGGEIFFANMKRFLANIDQWRFDGQKVTDTKRQAQAAHDFLLQFLKSNYSVDTNRDDDAAESQFHSIVPNFLWFSFDIKSEEWPLITKSINDHLSPITANDNFFRSGQTLFEKTNKAMLGKNLNDAFDTEQNFSVKSQIVKAMGKTLMAKLQEQMGDASINDLLKEITDRHAFQSIDFDEFKAELQKSMEQDMEQIIQATYSNKEQPFYAFENLESYALSDGASQSYQVKFETTNLSEVPGIIEVQIKDQVNDRVLERDVISLSPGQTKKWAGVTNQRPRLIINTLISQNIPQTISLNPSEFELKSGKKPENSITTIVKDQYQTREIIVDNEDSGFSVMSEANPPLLQELAFSDQNSDEFKNIYRAPRGRWSRTSNNNYFGRHIRSAHFVRSGSEIKKAIWTTPIATAGNYDVFVYSSSGEVWWNDQNKKTEINHYIIHHADGQDEVSFDKKKEKGWVFLGSYYLNEGEAKIELTNESEHRLVFADAVKWKRNDIISNK